MKRHWFVVIVCGVLASALVLGCGARLEVAKDKLREKIDSVLGTMDVERKEIEISVTGLREVGAGLGTAGISGFSWAVWDVRRGVTVGRLRGTT